MEINETLSALVQMFHYNDFQNLKRPNLDVLTRMVMAASQPKSDKVPGALSFRQCLCLMVLLAKLDTDVLL